MKIFTIFVAFIGFIHAKSSFKNTPLLSCSAFLADRADEPRLSRAIVFMITPKEVKSKILKRVWDKIKIPDNHYDCWEWGAFRNQWGYGMVRIGCYDSMQLSHRYIYAMTVGQIPSKLYVLHKCDNPPCCNPNHLFAGTQTDNMQDMVKKGRGKVPNGEGHIKSKLNDVKVREIRLRVAAGETQESVGKCFGVTQTTIGKVYLNHTWKHVK